MLSAVTDDAMTISDAAGFLMPREDSAPFDQLEHDADAQTVMDIAGAIFDRAAYAGAEESLARDWAKVLDIISRH